MKIAVESIEVAERIRKEVRKIGELAADIRQNELINPVAVMPLDGDPSRAGGEYQLLARLRRLRTVERNEESQIKVTAFPASDAEAALKLEYSENEQREPFTYSEKMDYAKLIEEIESAKAAERKSAGVKLSDADLTDLGAEGRKRETRSIVGEKIGMSGKQYDRAKYIAKNAPPEVIDELDRGERSIRGTYDEFRAKEKAAAPPSAPDVPTRNEPMMPAAPIPAPQSEPPKPKSLSAKEKRAMEMLPPKDRAAFEKILAFEEMSPEEKIAELGRRLKEANVRAAAAESKLARETELRKNAEDHLGATIEMLRSKLAEAHTRIAELEGGTSDEPDQHTD